MADETWTAARDDRGVDWDAGAVTWDSGVIWDQDTENPETWTAAED